MSDADPTALTNKLVYRRYKLWTAEPSAGPATAYFKYTALNILRSVTTFAAYCVAALPAGPVPANGPGVLMWSRQVPLFVSRVLLGVQKVSSLSTLRTLQSPEGYTDKRYSAV